MPERAARVPARSLSFDGYDAGVKAPGKEFAQRFTQGGHEQAESDEIGQEAGGQQERSSNKDHRPMRQLSGGEPATEDRMAGPSQLTSPLPVDQRRTDHRRHKNDCQRGEEPNPTTDRDEQTDLHDRGDDKDQKQQPGQPHPTTLPPPLFSTVVELRDLPSVDVLTDRLRDQLEVDGRPILPSGLLTEIARSAIDDARTAILAGGSADPILAGCDEASRFAMTRPQRIINATGVLLHTNLGRAPIAEAAAGAGAEAAAGYTNLEFDLTTGQRGGRGSYIETLLRRLTGAAAALVVNNTAGALLLSLASIAGKGSVVVSRGELIEIGGSFRLPSLMEASGARLIEVGTTNRTRTADYEAAAREASAILKVHPSNYRIEGFTDQVGYDTLAGIAHDNNIPFIADVGSGLLDARTPWLGGKPPSWLSAEPAVRQTLDAGADVVLFSGDKLLGGPQAGIAVGTTSAIATMRSHPIARAVRLGGTSMVILGYTLEMYASGKGADIPFWRMASLGWNELAIRHQAVLEASGRAGSIVEGASTPGAGSVPGELIPSPVLQLDGPPDAMWKALIANVPPIVGHRRTGALQLDLRTVSPDDDERVAEALRTHD